MATAVLFSGGLDSAVLLADEAARGAVVPVYVSAGLAWETPERAVADAFVAALARQQRDVAAVVPLAVGMQDVYAATHWAVQGRPPAYDTPDEDVYLPGRNIVLITKASVYCAAAHRPGSPLHRIVIGTLAHNPFPDATPEFRDALARAVSLGLAHEIAVDAPYAELDKAAVIRRGTALGVRFDLTLSCMSPHRLGDDRWMHCGTCSKCRERHDAFAAASLPDPTPYAAPPPR
jgi:7-cyano-7-deazaguanine synthase